VSKYTITHNFGMMPNQIKGLADDGLEFYFRGRHGKWQLFFGPVEDDDFTGLAYEGEHEQAGWFEKEEWEAFFWQVIDLVEQGKATELDQEQHTKDMEQLLVSLTTPAMGEDWKRVHALIKGEQK
jgi:hypothetical protein